MPPLWSGSCAFALLQSSDGRMMPKANKFLHSLVEEQLAAVPRRLLEDVIRRKIKAGGVDMPAAIEARLMDHIFSGSKERFYWDGGPDGSLDLTVTDAELEEVRAKLERIPSLLPDVVAGATDKTAGDILKRFNRQWPDEHVHQILEFQDFRENLEARWGKALDSLRLMLTIGRQIGAEFHKKLRKGKPSILSGTISRLHIRACQATDEIITLLETGHADGALARWRTLHEIAVVGTVLTDFGEDIAEQYVEHQKVEVKRGNDEYIACSALLGFPPLPSRDQRRIEAQFQAVIKKYGSPFGTPYGWAVPFLRAGKKPTFRDLETAAGRAALRSYYKLASYNVHAGPRGLFYSISSVGNPSGIVAGVSNAGLDEPGRLTALVFTQIQFMLFREPFTLEDTLRMQTLVKLRDQTIRAFEKAGRRLFRDETAHQKALGKMREQRKHRRTKRKR